MSEWRQLATEIRRASRGCDVVIDTLAQQGVTTLFGLPADSINALFDAARKNSRMSVITCRHESNAALMASAFGKLTETPAAVTATNGPGVTHLPVGTRDALLDNAPLVALCGAAPHHLSGTESFQGVDGQSLLEATTARSSGVWTADALEQLSGILTLAKCESVPVSVSIGQDVLTAAATRTQPRVIEMPAHWSSSQESVDRARALYAAAVSVAIVMGDLRGAPAGLVDFILSESIDAPVLSAPSCMHWPGWDRLPPNGRLTESNETGWNALRAADLVLVIGRWPYEVLDQMRSSTIQLCTAPSARTRTTATVTLLGPSWRDILDAVGGAGPGRRADDGRCPVAATDAGRELDSIIPPDAVVTMEPGVMSDFVFTELPERSRRFTSSFSGRTPGYAIPAAVGGRAALPDLHSVAIVDSLGWNNGHVEVLTSIKHRLGVSVIAVGSRDELVAVRAQASALGMNVSKSGDGRFESYTLYTVEASVAQQRTGTHDSSEATVATVQSTHPSTPYWPRETPARAFAYPETAALYAAGLSKSARSCPVLLAPDEQTLLREYNGLYDCAFDRVGLVVITTVSEDPAEIDRCWPLGDPEMHLDALPHLTVKAGRLGDTHLERALSLAELNDCVVHLRVGTPVSRSERAVRVGARRSDLAHCAESTLRGIANQLRSAQNVVIVSGRGACGASDGIALLAERLSAPIVATMGGGAGVDRSASFAGYIGSSGHRNAQEAVRDADLVLILGVSNRGGAFDTVGKGSVIDINNDPFTLANRRSNRRRILASVDEFIDAILGRVDFHGQAASTRRGVGLVRSSGSKTSRPATQSTWWRRIATTGPRTTGALRPSQIVRMLDEQIASDRQMKVVGDVGLNTLWLYRFKKSHENTIWTQNFATMGFALPAAVAASADGTPSIAVIGDGGMVMALPGLENLASDRPPVLIIVLDNERLGAIRYEQEIYGWPEFESNLTNGDLAQYAEAVGWAGHRVTHADSFRRALTGFLNEPTPTVLHVLCTPDEAPVPASMPSIPRTASMTYAWMRQGRLGVQSARSTIREVFRR